MMIIAFIAIAPSPLEKTQAITTPKTVSHAAPAVTAPAAAAQIVFNPNDQSTWPVCPANQVVWAQDGLCHEKPAEAAPVAQAAPTAPAVSISGLGSPIFDCSGLENLHGMQYIFCHESGAIPNRTNSEGCVGLGQACPASKLYNVCPTLDINCQIEFFAGYAAQRYGGWSGAESYWRSNRWW